MNVLTQNDMHIHSTRRGPSNLAVSVQGHHHTVRCMAVNAASSELIIAGDAGTPASPLCLTAWQASQEGQLQLTWRHGPQSSTGWLSWPARTTHSGWKLEASPDGKALAIAIPGAAAQAFSIQVTTDPVESATLFLTCTGHERHFMQRVLQELRKGNGDPVMLDTVAEQISWWSDTALASMSDQGSCSVQGIASAVDLLTPAPGDFPSGVCPCCPAFPIAGVLSIGFQQGWDARCSSCEHSDRYRAPLQAPPSFASVRRRGCRGGCLPCDVCRTGRAGSCRR